MPLQKSEQSFRLISIEPLETLQANVREIATEYGFQLQSGETTTQTAPFCGHNYFRQEMTLSDCASEVDVNRQVKQCLEAIEELADMTMADGYVELV